VYRLAAALLCALAPLALPAAPAPQPRPWFRGWSKPVDPVGDCKFERAGDRLAITVPGAGHGVDVERAHLAAPHLLRDVEGDFVVQVRIRADFRPAELGAKDVCRAAGIVLLDGTRLIDAIEWAARGGNPADDPTYNSNSFRVKLLSWWREWDGPPLGKPAYLRLERWGNWLEGKCSSDGKKWTRSGWRDQRLPRKLKVGVFAESTAEGTFKPTFDRFKLSRPARSR
jgi:regulation of enolase protein 1 (concanavalin A-like superfamily)